MKQLILHGEAMIFASSLPENACKIKPTNKEYHIIADSETTGNHHVVDYCDGVEFFESDGVQYMKNSKPTRVRCVHADRHSPVELEPGVWEFGIQKEYDHFEQNLQAVRD
jgi:hypothetical protein